MTSLTLVRRIAARPSIVFDALTTAEGIASWWGRTMGRCWRRKAMCASAATTWSASVCKMAASMRRAENTWRWSGPSAWS